MTGAGEDEFCLGEEIWMSEHRASIWSVGFGDSLVISKGVLKRGESEARFDIMLDESCGVNVMWKNTKGGTKINKHVFVFDSLCKPGTYWVDLNAENKESGLFDRVLMGEDKINGEGDGFLIKFLEQADEWVAKQDFYKEAVIISSGWRLFLAEEARKIAEREFDEAVKEGGRAVLLKHPSREMREMVIKNIGKKRGGR